MGKTKRTIWNQRIKKVRQSKRIARGVVWSIAFVVFWGILPILAMLLRANDGWLVLKGVVTLMFLIIVVPLVVLGISGFLFAVIIVSIIDKIWPEWEKNDDALKRARELLQDETKAQE